MITFGGGIRNKNDNNSFKNTGFSVICSFYGGKKPLLVENLACITSAQGFAANATVPSLNSLRSKLASPSLAVLATVLLWTRFSAQRAKGQFPKRGSQVNCHRLMCETLCILLLCDYQHAHPSLELQATADLGPSRTNSTFKAKGHAKLAHFSSQGHPQLTMNTGKGHPDISGRRTDSVSNSLLRLWVSTHRLLDQISTPILANKWKGDKKMMKTFSLSANPIPLQHTQKSRNGKALKWKAKNEKIINPQKYLYP